jgi:hypothetical protein
MDESRGGLLRAVLFAAGIGAAWVALNAGKPVHVDDTFFLYWARTISPLPGETPVANINWERFEEPFASQTQHYMPGWAILLSAARRAVGEDPRLLHWLQWPFATMFLVGAFMLARTFGAPPWATLLLCAVNPAFLLPTASLMADMPAMGLAILGLAVWHSTSGLTGRISAGLLIALGAWMKQSVLVLYPLLLFDAGMRVTRRPQDWIIAALSFALAGYYPNVPPSGADNGSIIGHVAWIVRATWKWPLTGAKLSYLLSTAGAVLLSPATCAFALAARRTPGPGDRAKVVLAGVVCIPVLARLGLWKRVLAPGVNIAGVPGTANDLWFYAAIALFLAWAWYALRPFREGGRAYLALWLGCSAIGFLFATWNPAVRPLIPALPPLAILFLSDLKRNCEARTYRAGVGLAFLASLWLGLSLAHADYVFAVCAKNAATDGAKVAKARKLPLVTNGSWGLRYYVEKAGGTVLERATDPLAGGAILLLPKLTDHRVLPDALRRRSRTIEGLACPSSRQWPFLLPARTIPPNRTVSAFHGGHLWFPYAFSRAPFEEVQLVEVRRIGRAGAVKER